MSSTILSAFGVRLSAGGARLSTSAAYPVGGAAADRAPAGMLRNPDFDAMDGWLSTSGSMFLTGGLLRIVNSAGSFFYQPWPNYVQAPVAGAPCKLFLLITALTAGAVRIVTNSAVRDAGGNVVQGLDETFYAAGYYVRDFIHDGDTINVQSVNFNGQNCTADVGFLQTQKQ